MSAGASQGRTLLGFGTPSPSQFKARTPRASRAASAVISPSSASVTESAEGSPSPTVVSAQRLASELKEEPQSTTFRTTTLPEADLIWQSQLVADIEAKNRQAEKEQRQQAADKERLRSASVTSQKIRTVSSSGSETGVAPASPPAPASARPALKDYGSRRRISAVSPSLVADTSSSFEESAPIRAAQLGREIPLPLPTRVLGEQDEGEPSSLARITALGSSIASPRRTSRRGYVAPGETVEALQNVPRDIMTPAVMPSYPDSAIASDVASPARCSDAAEAESVDEQHFAQSLEATPLRKKRGILLSSTRSPAGSIGRRSRRIGGSTTTPSAGEASSLHSHDASGASSRGDPQGSVSYEDAAFEGTLDEAAAVNDPVITFPASESDSGSYSSPGRTSFEASLDIRRQRSFDHQSDLSTGNLSGRDLGVSRTTQRDSFDGEDQDVDDTFEDGASIVASQDDQSTAATVFDPAVPADRKSETPEALTADETGDTADDDDAFDDTSSLHSEFSRLGSYGKVQSHTTGVSRAAFPPTLPARRRTGNEGVTRSPPPSPSVRLRNSTSACSQAAEAEAARRKADIQSQMQGQREREEWERRILNADWEELEVARFLNEFGKHVYQVRATGPLDPNHQSLTQSLFPSTYEFTDFSTDSEHPKFDRLSYSIAWLTALLAYISPTRMVDLQATLPMGDEAEASAAAKTAQTPEEFRWQALKANGERFYLSALPLYETLGSRLRKTWRWESKIKTAFSLVAYTFLWWRGLLLASSIFATIMLVFTLKTYPPQPDTLREIMARQRRRAEGNRSDQRKAKAEVKPFTDAFDSGQGGVTTGSLAASAVVAADSLATSINPARTPTPSRYSLVAEVSQRYGLQASILAGALADGHERAKNFALWRSPRATWRLLLWLSITFFITLGLLTPIVIVRSPGAILGLVFFFIAPIAEFRPQWMGVEWSNPFDWIFAGVPNDAQYSLEILRDRAAKGKPLISDPALLLRPDEATFVSSDVEEEDEATSTARGTTSITTASAGPKSNKINWSKWSDRVLKGKTMAIRGSEMIAGSRSIPMPRLPVNESQPSAGFGSFLLTNFSKGVNFGLETIEARSAQAAAAGSTKGNGQGALSDEADVDGTYWSIYENCCGHLVITPQTVTFRSLFAKRPRGRRGTGTSSSISSLGDADTGAGAGSTSLDQPILDPLTRELTIPASELEKQRPKVKILLQIDVNQIRGLKKLDPRYLPYGSKWSATAAGGEGLRIIVKTRDAKGTSSLTEFDLWQVVKRNEAFNRLVALVPQEWEKVF